MAAAYDTQRMRSASVATRAVARDATDELTEAENLFRNAKLRHALLVAYKAFADAAGKASFLVITVVAAHRLSPWAFGVFGLGTTIGWLLAVATDFGMQMHLARAVASDQSRAFAILRRWWWRRLAAAFGGMAALLLLLEITAIERALALPLALFALLYVLTSLVEFINYFYRGLSRTDIESTLTLWQRGAGLLLGVAALYWRPDVTVLALALLVPAVASLAWSLAHASGMRVETRRPRLTTSCPMSFRSAWASCFQLCTSASTSCWCSGGSGPKPSAATTRYFVSWTRCVCSPRRSWQSRFPGSARLAPTGPCGRRRHGHRRGDRCGGPGVGAR